MHCSNGNYDFSLCNSSRSLVLKAKLFALLAYHNYMHVSVFYPILSGVIDGSIEMMYNYNVIIILTKVYHIFIIMVLNVILIHHATS